MRSTWGDAEHGDKLIGLALVHQANVICRFADRVLAGSVGRCRAGVHSTHSLVQDARRHGIEQEPRPRTLRCRSHPRMGPATGGATIPHRLSRSFPVVIEA